MYDLLSQSILSHLPRTSKVSIAPFNVFTRLPRDSKFELLMRGEWLKVVVVIHVEE